MAQQTIQPESKAVSNWFLWSTIVIAGALFYLRFGYQVGYSDQDEFVPLVLSWLDPALFTTDWFVQLQQENFSIRHIFAGLLAVLSYVFPLTWSLFLLHLATWTVLVSALVRISYLLYRNELVALSFVLVALVLSSRVNPGGNDVVHALLVPSSVAWALGFWSFANLLHAQTTRAGWMLAVAILIHPLVGLQLASIILVTVVMTRLPGWKSLLYPVILVSIPSILLFLDLGSSGTTPTINPDEGILQANILTQIRAPHHYLIAFTSLKTWLAWGILALGGGIAWASFRIKLRSSPDLRFTMALFAVSLAVVGGSVAVLALRPDSFLTRLQPLNVAVLVRMVALLAISARMVSFISRIGRVGSWLTKGNDRLSKPTFLALSCAFLIVVVVWIKPWYDGSNQHLPHPGFQDQIDMDTAEWIQSNTDLEAVFVIPPVVSGFQIATHRAQFVNFKAFPFNGDQAVAWIERLQQIAPVENLNPGGSALLVRFQNAFLNLPSSHFYSLNDSEGVSYIVLPKPLNPSWSDEKAAMCSPEWCVFNLNDPS